MVLTALLALAQTQSPSAPAPTLEFYQRHFVVREGETVERLPMQLPPPTPKLSMLYRRGRTFVAWDERGLTIRAGTTTRSTRMPEIAVSPRAFEREQILETLELVKKGTRKKEADSLAGSFRIGNDAFFLLRWTDKSNAPWLEALVKVDLAQPKPKPQYVGRFDGFSLADRSLDDSMFLFADRLGVVTKTAAEWGVASYDPATDTFSWRPYGDQLMGYWAISRRLGLFVERTAYGTTLCGRVDLASGNRKTLAEGRGPARFVDEASPPLAVLRFANRMVLRNLDSGSELALPKDSAVRRGKLGVVVWSPVTAPTGATLYEPENWKARAVWYAPPPPASQNP